MSLLPSKEEITLLLDWVQESLALYGQDVVVYSRDSYSMYLDDTKYSGGTSLKVLLQNNPRKKLLDDLGWYQEFKDTQSTLVFLPYAIDGKVVHLREKDVLLFNDHTPLMIAQLNRDFLYGLWFVAQCVPFEMDNKEVGRESVGTQSKFFRQDREEVF